MCVCCQAQYMFLHQSTLELLSSKGNSQSIWFVNYSALDKMDSLDAMEGESHINTHIRKNHNMPVIAQSTHLLMFAGDVELEWEETTM